MKKIGIIGGGASGLVSAWLLEGQYDVTLFEQSQKLGGHADTVYLNLEGKKIAIEAGFEFFNPKMFPHFCKLLEHLRVPVRSYDINYSYFKKDNKSLYILPPYRNGKIFWNSLYPSKIFNMLQLKYVMAKGKKIIASKNCSITLEQFLNSLYLTKSFKKNFFYHLFCAGWGAKPHEFKTFCAYNILCYIIKNEPSGFKQAEWLEVIDGMSFYIDRLAKELKNTKIKISHKIENVRYDGKQYIVNEERFFDYLIIATNAHDASELIKQIPHAEDMRNLLNMIDYVDTTIAIHSDLRFLPKNKKNWSVANVYNDGKNSMLTIFKNRNLKVPIFRSWVFKDSIYPENIYEIKHFKHAKPNLNYFKVQKGIESLQGNNNLWLAGLYTNDIDSHESAIVSGIKIAQTLASNSERLKKLL